MMMIMLIIRIMLKIMIILMIKVWDIMSAIALSQWSTTIGTPRLVIPIIIIMNFIIIISYLQAC